MATTSSLPANVHISTHPCLLAKLSHLRSCRTNARETKSLVHEIALILGCEALAGSVHISPNGTVSLFSLRICFRRGGTMYITRLCRDWCNYGGLLGYVVLYERRTAVLIFSSPSAERICRMRRRWDIIIRRKP